MRATLLVSTQNIDRLWGRTSVHYSRLPPEQNPASNWLAPLPCFLFLLEAGLPDMAVPDAGLVRGPAHPLLADYGANLITWGILPVSLCIRDCDATDARVRGDPSAASAVNRWCT